MTTTKTPTRVAEIEFEVKRDWDAGAPVAGRHLIGDGLPLMVQPTKVRLDNDGKHHHWIEMSATWTLTHDGVGWRATTDAAGWEGSREHVMRLADAAGPFGSSYVGALPTGTGDFVLEPGVTYQLRLGADAGRSKTILILSTIQ